MDISVIVRKCRERGMTVASLERVLKFSNGTISKWRTSSPSVSKAKAVADFFGCPIEDLLDGKEGDS
ncbi:MAG: helix-turn-helix transcriptional regulator [Oscillospiraceae bacterium]|nr:helix-turn-helix transcriptional regulator [Oscillospiraceae bacterium]